MRAKILITLATVAATLIPALPAEAGCRPVCNVSGGLTGSNLNLPFAEGAFQWNLNFDGAVVEPSGATRRVTSSARLYGMIESVQGTRVSGVGTMAVFDTGEGARLAAVPVQINGVTRGAGVQRAVLEPYGAGVSHGATITLIEGTLRGAFHAPRLTDDELSGVDVTLTAPGDFVVGHTFTITGSVRRSDGTPLPSVPVDIEVNGGYLKRVQTRNDGSWNTEIRFTVAQPRDLRAVAFGQSPTPAASPVVRVSPTYLLTLAAAGPGTVVAAGTMCTTTCTVRVPAGSWVPVTHRASRFHLFSAWSGACTGPGSCAVGMTDHRSVTGAFEKLNWDVVESEPNNTSGTADAAIVPGLFAGNLTAGDVDVVQITVPVATTLYADTFDRFLGCTEPIDTTITIRAAGGAQLGFDDDDGPGFCSSLAVPVLPGTTRIEVRPFGTTTAEEYRLQLRFSDPTEPNDTLATANIVTLPLDRIGAISPIGDHDYVRFTVDEPFMNVTFEVFDQTGSTCANGIDPILFVYDAEGTSYEGWADDDTGPGLCPSLTASPSPGTYYARISDYQDNSVIPAYRLLISQSSWYPTPYPSGEPLP